MVKIETQCSRPVLKQPEKALANSRTEKLSVFRAVISTREFSPVPFKAKYLQVCPESHGKFDFSIYSADYKDSMAEGEGFGMPLGIDNTQVTDFKRRHKRSKL